jgi:hypothetical protein
MRSYHSVRTPETKSTGGAVPTSDRSVWQTSYPDIPGSGTSRMIATGIVERAMSSAASPVSACCTV